MLSSCLPQPLFSGYPSAYLHVQVLQKLQLSQQPLERHVVFERGFGGSKLFILHANHVLFVFFRSMRSRARHVTLTNGI